MPFLTEELWQRLRASGPDRHVRPISIALAPYPQYRQELTDYTAEREIEVLQEVVTMARTLRTEAKLDPRQPIEGALYSRGAGLEVARRQADAIKKLANVNLEFRAEAAPKAAASRSTAEFDLVLRLPEAQEEAQRKRMEKEREQLVKNIANSARQLSDETFLRRAPEQVVGSLRRKLADYESQLRKIDGVL
jgi:valyl-tRNA synthetase